MVQQVKELAIKADHMILVLGLMYEEKTAGHLLTSTRVQWHAPPPN